MMFLLFGETRFRESWRELIIILFPSLFGLSKSHNYQFHWFEQYVFRFLPDKPCKNHWEGGGRELLTEMCLVLHRLQAI
jgi:hypothetical protein